MSMDYTGAELMTVTDNVDGRGFGFTEQDLHDIVAVFNGLGLQGRVPLKFGHNTQQPMTDGQPALGWLKSVYVQGKKLLGDFTDMPRVVYDAIKAGLYKNVSVELLRDVQAGTRVIPWVLDAVALLGADQPAFGNLKDLQSLLFSRRTALRARGRVSLTRAKFSTTQSEEVNSMSVTPEQMQKAIADALAAQDVKTSEKFTKLETDHKVAIAEKDKELKKERASAKRTRWTEKFNSKIEAKQLKPADFTRFEKMSGMKDDDRILDTEDSIVDEFISATETKVVAKVSGTQTISEEITVPENATTAELMKAYIEVARVKNGIKVDDHAGVMAMFSRVARQQPKLYAAYLEDPNGPFVDTDA